jgi:hypothetical protein
MNKEHEDILNEVYDNYVKIVESNKELYLEREEYTRDILTKDDFIKESKYNNEFSEKWGLKIEERELCLEERMGLCKEKWDYSWNRTINLEDIEWRMNNEWNIPTKLITITYNNETLESYDLVI